MESTAWILRFANSDFTLIESQGNVFFLGGEMILNMKPLFGAFFFSLVIDDF